MYIYRSMCYIKSWFRVILAIHEKIFITFMVCSLCHMLATIKLNEIIHEDHTELTQMQRDSIKWKKILFAMSILSTIGLLIFFAKHRFYCHDLGECFFSNDFLDSLFHFIFFFLIVNVLFVYSIQLVCIFWIFDSYCEHVVPFYHYMGFPLPVHVGGARAPFETWRNIPEILSKTGLNYEQQIKQAWFIIQSLRIIN